MQLWRMDVATMANGSICQILNNDAPKKKDVQWPEEDLVVSFLPQNIY